MEETRPKKLGAGASVAYSSLQVRSQQYSLVLHEQLVDSLQEVRLSAVPIQSKIALSCSALRMIVYVRIGDFFAIMRKKAKL